VRLSVDENELASPEELVAFQERFLRLLERRTAIYTMGDSTSVPNHVAADLLRSICFVLGIDPDESEVPQRLLSVDLEDEFRQGLAEIERTVERAQALWQEVCVAMPMFPNLALRDTLTSIGDFFARYDYRSMAHEIPCSIDYPLCHPVPESLSGVDYITEYLRRLMIEAQFLQRFEFKACDRVVARSYADHIELLINLYEPVATNAIGLVLAGKDPVGLLIVDEDRAEIARRLGSVAEAEQGRVIREAALEVCDALGVEGRGAREYLCELAPELLPRVAVGLAHGGLRGVFVG
jgi:hypothetical protein